MARCTAMATIVWLACPVAEARAVTQRQDATRPEAQRIQELYDQANAAAAAGDIPKATELQRQAAGIAEPLLATAADHWPARCAVAIGRLLRVPPEPLAAGQVIGDLSRDPLVFEQQSLGWLLTAAELFRRLGRDGRSEEIAAYLVGPRLRQLAQTADEPPPAGEVIDQQLTLLWLHAQLTGAVDRPALWQPGVASWSAARAISEQLAAQPQLSLARRQWLLSLAETQLVVIGRLAAVKAAPFDDPATAQAASEAIEAMITKLTGQLFDADPANPHATVARASQTLRASSPTDALEILEQALAGPAPPVPDKADVAQHRAGVYQRRLVLVNARARLLRSLGRTKDELRFLDSEIVRAGDSLTLDLVTLKLEALLTAAASGPPILGLDEEIVLACRLAVTVSGDAKLLWARRLEADSLLRMGRTRDALAAAETVADRIPDDPSLLRITGVAAAALDQSDDADRRLRWLWQLWKDNQQSDNPVMLQALEGQVTAALGQLSQVGRPLVAIPWAEAYLAVKPRDLAVRKLLADLLRYRIETGPPKWDVNIVRQALDQYDALLAEDPDNLEYSNNAAWLAIKGLDDAQIANRYTRPLIRIAEGPGPPPALVDTLAAILNRQGRYAQSVELLEKVLARSNAGLSCHYHYAEAMAGLGRNQQALMRLETIAAAQRPSTPREKVEVEGLLRKLRISVAAEEDNKVPKP